MKNIRILLISIPVIIVISAIIGCVITFPSAPNAALARIFIDLGALIALVSITYTLPKPDPIHIDDIVDGLRDLAKNRFDRRLSIKPDELFQVRQAFNELAGTLSDSRDPSLTYIRYNPMNRVEPKVTPLPPVHHSHHPELGQVKSAPEFTIAEEREILPSSTLELLKEPEPEIALQFDSSEEADEELVADLSQKLDEQPFETSNQDSENSSEAPAETLMQTEQLAEPEPEKAQVRPETYASDIGAADLFLLFERFKAAHDRPDENVVDFDDFISTVQKAREDLIRSHQCRNVKFEVVSEAGAVALRPRLIR